MADEPKAKEQKNPLREITQPFIDLFHAPRALWGINIAYVIEGMCYFGVLSYLAIYFSDFVFQAVEHADEWSHNMVMVLTAGITLSMFLLGFVADKWGVRFALIAAFVFLLIGRTIIAGSPIMLGLEPARPGVFVGDKVSLHITRIDTKDGNKAITKATVIANDQGGADVGGELAIDLANGEGTAPSKALESRLIKLSEATVVSGKDIAWEVQYGSGPTTASLLAHPAEQVGLCEGAVISLDSAYVNVREGNDDDVEYVIRTHWTDDFSRVDKAEDTEESGGEDRADSHEEEQKAKERWPITDESAAAGNAKAISIAELRDMDDGPLDVILRDAYVTYVRNGGYFLQSERNGPAIFAFVSPLWSNLHLMTMLGIVIITIGYGMYQPAAYAGVRKFTTPKTAAMGFAMLYALMNLGGWLPTFAFLLRDEDFLNLGIPGTYAFYAACTLLALLVTIFILTRKTVARAAATAKAETEAIEKAEKAKKGEEASASPDMRQCPHEGCNEKNPVDAKHCRRCGRDLEPVKEATAVVSEGGELFGSQSVPLHMWLLAAALIGAVYWRVPTPWSHYVAAAIAVSWVALSVIPATARFLARHPLADAKFAFFIFALIPVQTLFTYNWLVLPQYISRAFEGWIGDYFEIAANANPILIFIAVPIIAAMTLKAKVYNMMIYGTFIMAAPAFLLVLGPHWYTLAAYLLIMTIGEAMWQPRFLQYAAEIAPEGRTGQYMGVAQFPWFLTKVLVPALYSGWMMDRYCPAEGPKDTEFMWLIFACIAMCSTVLLILAKGWLGKDFKTKAD